MTQALTLTIDNKTDGVYYTLKTMTELYTRGENDILLVVSVPEDLLDDDDVASLRKRGADLSRRNGVDVVLKYRTHGAQTYQFDAFRGGCPQGGTVETFEADWDYRLNLWCAGDAEPWRTWELGEEPVKKPESKECRCDSCDVHYTAIEL